MKDGNRDIQLGKMHCGILDRERNRERKRVRSPVGQGAEGCHRGCVKERKMEIEISKCERWSRET